jgi:hypothetical protein
MTDINLCDAVVPLPPHLAGGDLSSQRCGRTLQQYEQRQNRPFHEPGRRLSLHCFNYFSIIFCLFGGNINNGTCIENHQPKGFQCKARQALFI